MSILEKVQQRGSDPETVIGRLKSQVGEILRAYRHSWDVYSELLQNSVDSINRRYRILNDPDFYLYDEFRHQNPLFESAPAFTGQIKIKVNIPEREIEIRDNGVGINPEKIEEFLLPEGTDKVLSQEYGFKGFGLTYIAFISQEFQIISRPFSPVNHVQASELKLSGLFEWLADETNSIQFPDSPIPNTTSTQVDLGDFNTLIKLKLADDYSVSFPAVSSAELAVELANCGWKTSSSGLKKPTGFEYILRTRTAIGNTRPLFSSAPKVPIDIHLSIVVSKDEMVEDINIPYRYYHPKEHEEISISSFDFMDYFDRFKRPANREFRGLYHTITSVDVGTRRPLRCNVAIAAISSTRLSNIEADLGLSAVETGDVDISYGIHLAIDGMPTGLRIDDWDMRGHFLKRYFVVVDAEMDISNQLDPGRKGISRYYARLISDRVRSLLNETVEDSAPFSQYASKYLNHGRGREEGGLPPQDFLIKVGQARAQQEQDKQNKGDLLRSLSMTSTLAHLPRDEQEVIALFFELLTARIIKGYKTIYLSSKAVYDAAFEYEIDCIPENIFPEDRLGIGQVLVRDLKNTGQVRYLHSNYYTGVTTHPELCVDYKRNLGAFLEEAGKPSQLNKDPKLIDLLIFWNTDVPSSISSTSYTLDRVSENQRIFHGTTHRLGLIGQHTTEMFCISLEDVLTRPPE